MGKRSMFKLKSGNKMAGSTFKMMGSSPMKDPGHGETQEGHGHAWNTPGRYADTLGKVTADMTDAELLALSKENRTSDETGRLKSGKFGASIHDLQKQRTSLVKSTEKTEETEPIVTETKETIMPVTLQDTRDYVLKDVLGSKQSEKRKQEVEAAQDSGANEKLRQAVEKKYGMPYHEIEGALGEEASQMAGDAVIDAQGNILPMSSASGGFRSDDGSGILKKAPGFKMPGYGKRKKQGKTLNQVINQK